jgi:hypothetical protein
MGDDSIDMVILDVNIGCVVTVVMRACPILVRALVLKRPPAWRAARGEPAFFAHLNLLLHLGRAVRIDRRLTLG